MTGPTGAASTGTAGPTGAASTGPTGPTGAAATGPTGAGATGATGASSTGLAYAMFYAPGTGTPTTASGVAVAFPQSGPTSGSITRSGAHPTFDFVIANAGVYHISWQVTDSTGATQTQLASGGFGAYAAIAGTTVGRAVASSQIVGSALITATAGMIVSVLNPGTNTISQPPPDGTETAIEDASLVFRQIA